MVIVNSESWRSDVCDDHVRRGTAGNRWMISHESFERAAKLREKPVFGLGDFVTAQLREPSEQRRFLVREVCRGVNDHLNEEIATSTALEMWDPTPAESLDGSGLGSGINSDLLITIQSLEHQSGTERGLGDRDVETMHKVVALPLETWILGDSDVDVKIASRTLPHTNSATPSDTKCCSCVDSGRYLDGI